MTTTDNTIVKTEDNTAGILSITASVPSPTPYDDKVVGFRTMRGDGYLSVREVRNFLARSGKVPDCTEPQARGIIKKAGWTASKLNESVDDSTSPMSMFYHYSDVIAYNPSAKVNKAKQCVSTPLTEEQRAFIVNLVKKNAPKDWQNFTFDLAYRYKD